MNIFRLAGDVSHILAIVILLYRIWTKKSSSGMCYQRYCARVCALLLIRPVPFLTTGISGKSQILFALVYTTRYLDLPHFISLYNTTLKILFIVASWTTV